MDTNKQLEILRLSTEQLGKGLSGLLDQEHLKEMRYLEQEAAIHALVSITLQIAEHLGLPLRDVEDTYEALKSRKLTQLLTSTEDQFPDVAARLDQSRSVSLYVEDGIAPLFHSTDL